MSRPSAPILSRDGIVDAALEIVDAAGLAALTYRKLATRLGVRPSSLYNHIDDRGQLLDLMVGRVMEQIDLSPLELPDLREAVFGQALAFMAALERHPNMMETIAIRPVRSRASFTYYERMLERLTGAGIDPVEALRMLFAIDDYCIGAALNREDSIDIDRAGNDFPLLQSAYAAYARATYRVDALRRIVDAIGIVPS